MACPPIPTPPRNCWRGCAGDIRSLRMRSLIAVAILVGLAVPASPAAAQKITIAVVPSVPGGATYVALDKGYFRDAGLDVDIERIDSLGKAVAFLATNQVQ